MAKKTKSKPGQRPRFISRLYSFLKSKYGLFLLAAGIAIHVIMAYNFNFTQDDSFITFRYAANFIDGHGLVFNIGERVEGYTNFLWTIFIILARLAGYELVSFSRVFGVIFGGLGIAAAYMLALHVFMKDTFRAGAVALVLGAIPSYAYWSVSGLETPAFGLAVTLVLYAYMRGSYMTAPMAVIATLLRPEGAAVFAFIVAYDIIKRRRIGRQITVGLVVYFAALAPYLVFKYYYYGGLVPNTFYAKSGTVLENLPDGIEYIGTYFWHYLGAGAFILPAFLIIKKEYRRGLLLLCFFIAYTIYIALIGGDVLKVHRFFVPIMAVVATLIVYGMTVLLKKIPLVIAALIIIMAWGIFIPRGHVSSFLTAERFLIRKMVNMANNLKATDKSNFKVVISTIGVFSYNLKGHTVIDMLGLTDSTIARHPEPPIEGLESTWKERSYNTPYILGLEPEYILFSTGHKPSAPAERALFMYSQFLKSYRIIGFFFDGQLHDVYKKYFPYDSEIVRDVDVEFVQSYNKGINLKNKGDTRNAMLQFWKCDQYVSPSVFPYARQYQASIWRDSKQIKKWIDVTMEVIYADTMCYMAYRDAYFYELAIAKNPEAAAKYRRRLEDLVPWYLPRLDSLIQSTTE
jgi:hypothetical protein